MKSGTRSIVVVLLLAICICFSLVSCYEQMEWDYYSERDNFIDATGTVSHIAYNADYTALYIEFSSLSPEFDDICFKIVGDNILIVQKNKILEKIEIGDEVSFSTAPRYFGDGYVMPIVAISVDGESLLEFEEGYANFLDWLQK